MIKINDDIQIPDNEIELFPIGAKGPGGQSVNKSSTAIHLRFDIMSSSLPPECKKKLLGLRDQRVTKSGVIVIKSMRHRSLENNREDALHRLYAMIKSAIAVTRERKPVKPGLSAKRRRLDQKTRRSRVKALRGKVDPAGD
jgi:ribosome-associated protein